ncbi:histidine phosphatase family protein [Branchiibius cervicis]|uniref:Histidine phosphatase family protein n=1 Tax=Branchiibius cervicis TaxID=908252 RepID=A0ABW2ATM3_9MICO
MTGRRLIIWRHGQTTYNAEGRWQGQLDVPLSELGREQARAGAHALLAYDIDAIWASDLSRASATAESLAQLVDLPIAFDKRFREIDAGSWSGMTAAEVKEQYADMQARVEAGRTCPAAATARRSLR